MPNVLCTPQDSGNGLLETTLCFEHAIAGTFRTYYVIADNTLGRRAEAVELHPGVRLINIYKYYKCASIL